MDSAPTKHDEAAPHPLIAAVKSEVASIDWIEEAVVRLRESGHVFEGNVWFVPAQGADPVDRVEQLTSHLREFDWRLADIVVSPVRSIEGAPEGLRIGR
jgi:hypothetical protein